MKGHCRTGIHAPPEACPWRNRRTASSTCSGLQQRQPVTGRLWRLTDA